ncbi:MAG TPA: hypothetical protein VGN13_12225 [Solirubrobacteraceae bacterium]|jgi:hypothetical protein
MTGTLIEGLTLADQLGLDALRHDRDTAGPGLSLAELAQATGRRHLKGFFARLHAEGYQLGETATGRVQLGHAEPQLEQPVSVDEVAPLLDGGRLFQLPSQPHYTSRAA